MPSASFLGSRNGSLSRAAVVMEAGGVTIDAEPAAAPKKEYKPEMFGNKFVKKSDISKNPIYNIASIGVEAKNGKLPKIESF